MKKFLAIVLALACILSLCACGGNGDTNKGGSGSGDKGNVNAEGKVKLTIGIPTNALVLDHDNNALTKWVEETCNVELVFEEYAGGTDVATQISTAIAARQELPDILYGISLGDSVITRYGRDGYFVDLSDYYADKEGASKNFWDRMTNELSEYDQESILRKITDAETGEIYTVPCVETSLTDKMGWQTWINQKWLDNLGLKAPTTTDELIAVLKAFRDKDADGDGDTEDEIPLYGSQSAGNSQPIDWLLNLFCYYNRNRMFNVGKDGKLYAVYTTDEYREGLKFINTLYKEELLTQMVWTAGSDMKNVVTPPSGEAMCGIFLGHLTTCTIFGSPVLQEYVPLQTWGNVVREDSSCSKTTFITESCKNVDKAFEVLMTMWTWDGSMRIRYGEKGVNWDDADEGAISDMGLPCTYKLLRDPINEQSTSKWAKIASTLNVYAELETAQVDQQTDPWYAMRTKLAADSYALFAEAEAKMDLSIKCPLLTFTDEEKDRTSEVRTNVGDYQSKAQMDFITGLKDPHKDADWNAYLAELDKLGMKIVIDYHQTSYDRGA